MLDPIVNFFTRIFQWIGRGIGLSDRRDPVAVPVGRALVYAARLDPEGGARPRFAGLIGLYANFFYATQCVERISTRTTSTHTRSRTATFLPANRLPPAPAPTRAKTCGNSAIVQVAADLTDFNVNQNAWISSMMLYKLGLVRHRLGSTRRSSTTRPRSSVASTRRCAARRRNSSTISAACAATSQIDADLQDARGNLQFDEDTWYFGLNPFGPKTPTPSYYRVGDQGSAHVQRPAGDLQCRCSTPAPTI